MIGAPEEEKESEKISEKVTDENFPNRRKEMAAQVQEAEGPTQQGFPASLGTRTSFTEGNFSMDCGGGGGPGGHMSKESGR